MTEDAARDRMFELHRQNAERAASNQKGAKTITEHELIRAGREHLYNAGVNLDAGNHEQYCKHMQHCLDLLLEELVSESPDLADRPAGKFNPERVLEDIAISIKHRTISNAHRWYIIYYHDRLTCVPTSVNIPRQIILHEFTEQMVNLGFTVAYWNQLKQNVTKLYKEITK